MRSRSVVRLRCLGGWAMMAATLLCARAANTPIKHDFLAIDEGLGTLLHVDENNPAKDWIVPVAHPMPRDLQLVGSGRVLVGHDAGYSEFDIATGKLLVTVARYKGVTSARRLPNGNTVVAGVNLAAATGVVLLEVDDSGAQRRKIVTAGNYVRLVRETSAGTFLLMTDTRIREIDRTGEVRHDWSVPGFRHAWKAVRLQNGHTLASAGFGACLVELDSAGTTRRTFGGKAEVPAAVNANFYATFQLLGNGHVVVANWQGHGRPRRVRGAIDRIRSRGSARVAMERCAADFLAARCTDPRRPRSHAIPR